MSKEVKWPDGFRVSRAQLLRRIIVQAILELGTEIEGEEKEKFRSLKAGILLPLFSMEPLLQSSVPFEREFYLELVVPKVNAILADEFSPLKELEVCTENDVGDAFRRLRKQLKEVVQRRQALSDEIRAVRELLHKTLRHEQWSLRFKLEQAQVDFEAVSAAVFEKKFASIANSVLNLYRDYRYDEAVNAVREKSEKEKAALQKELDRRIKMHAIYKKALVLNPSLDDLLEKYQSLTDSLKSLQKLS